MRTLHNKPTDTSQRRISKLVRRYLHLTSTPYPIVLEDGFSPPRQEGEPAYYTTLSGKTRVYYPHAYGYRTLYHRSTIHLVVGTGWLLEHLMEDELRRAAPELRPDIDIRIVRDYLMDRGLLND